MLTRKLRDVHESFDSVSDTDKRAEWDELGDLSRSNLTDCVRAREYLPWVFLSCLERKRYALAVHVHLENLDGNLLSNFDNLAGVLNVLPAEFRNVDETVNATEVHESSEVHDGRNDTLTDLTLLQIHQERAAALRLRLLEKRTA